MLVRERQGLRNVGFGVYYMSRVTRNGTRKLLFTSPCHGGNSAGIRDVDEEALTDGLAFVVSVLLLGCTRAEMEWAAQKVKEYRLARIEPSLNGLQEASFLLTAHFVHKNMRVRSRWSRTIGGPWPAKEPSA